MARKYRYHKYYAVLWRYPESPEYKYQVYLTKKEANIMYQRLRNNHLVIHVELIRRIKATSRHKGEIDIETL